MAATRSPGARDQAKEFLTDFLCDDPALKTDIEEAGDAHGISNRTLFRAKDELGIIVEKGKGVTHGKWTWRLPDQQRPQQERVARERCLRLSSEGVSVLAMLAILAPSA
jgi:hypothetical protein